MSDFSEFLYVRVVNPGTENEYVICGPDPTYVSDFEIDGSDSVSPKVARYALVGTGSIHFTAPLYIEDEEA